MPTRLVRRPRPDPPEPADEFPEDLARLRAALAARGYEASDDDIFWAWRQHSDEVAAYWLCLAGDDGHLTRVLLRHMMELTP